MRWKENSGRQEEILSINIESRLATLGAPSRQRRFDKHRYWDKMSRMESNVMQQEGLIERQRSDRRNTRCYVTSNP